MSTRLCGFIVSWNHSKYLGHIVVRGNPVQRYFFYGTAVIDGPEPFFSAEVEFEVGSKPVQPGHFPHAINITVIEPMSGLDVLKGGGAE